MGQGVEDGPGAALSDCNQWSKCGSQKVENRLYCHRGGLKSWEIIKARAWRLGRISACACGATQVGAQRAPTVPREIRPDAWLTLGAIEMCFESVTPRRLPLSSCAASRSGGNVARDVRSTLTVFFQVGLACLCGTASAPAPAYLTTPPFGR